MTPLAEIVDYDSLVRALKDRLNQLDLSHETVSAISGLPDRYSSKVLSLTGCKRIGMLSLGPLLGALGIKLIAVEDHEAIARNRSRYVVRDAAHLRSAKARWERPSGVLTRRERRAEQEVAQHVGD